MAAMRTALLLAICLGLLGVAKAQSVNVTVVFYEDDNQSGDSEAFPVSVGGECTPCQSNPRVAPAPEGMDDDDDASTSPPSEGDDDDDDDNSPPSPPTADGDDDDDSSASPPSDGDDDDDSSSSPPSDGDDDDDSSASPPSDGDDDDDSSASPPSDGGDDDDDNDTDNEFESYSLMFPAGTTTEGYSLIVYDSSTCSGRNATLTTMQGQIPDELEDDVDSWRVCPPGASA